LLRVLLITDKKAGHESISRGLIKGLREEWETETVEVYAKIRAKFLKKIATIMLNHLSLTKKNIPLLTKLFYKNQTFDFNQKFDLVVSTGGDTSFLNILMSSYLNIPNIYCSSLRGLKPTLFTHTVSIINNHIPNEIVVDFPPIHVEIKEKELKGKYIAILIGGATKNYRFRDDEFVKLVKNSIELAKKMGYKILLTTSRRTPVKVEKKIKELYKQNKKTIQKCVLYNEKPLKVVNFFLSNADVIFCTEESGSMITESILAKKRLYTIKPKQTNLNRLYRLFIENITQKGYAHSVLVDNIEKITLMKNFHYIEEKPDKIIRNKIRNIVEFKFLKKRYIAIIVTNLAGSGAEKIALMQAKMFRENGHNVVLFLLDNIIAYDTDNFNFPIITLTNKKDKYKFLGKIGDKIYANILNKKMNEFGTFDTVISNLPRADRIVKQLNHPNKYFVIHMSYKAELEKFKKRRAKRKLKLYRYLYTNENIITVAKAIITDFDILNIKYKKATTIYNPFDFKEIRQKGDEAIELNYDYIIFPSAFRTQKRYDVMLDAVKLLKTDIKLLILAKVNSELTEMIRSRGLEHRVKILGFQQNPYKYIKKAKLLVLSSDREGLPTIIIESLILGTPVVSTDCPTGPREILRDDLSFWLVQMENPKKLAEKIDMALTRKIKVNDDIIARFHKDYIYKEYEQLCLK